VFLWENKVIVTMKNLLRKVFSITASLLITNYYLLTTLLSPALAQAWKTVKEFEDGTPVYDVQGESNPGAATFESFEAIFNNVLTVVFSLAALAAFVMLIIGGFRYLTAAGDPKASEQARGTITWAIVGLLFLIGAWFVLGLISEFTGIESILKFEIPT